MRKALISGITGQTGAYLAHYLVKSGYHVIGGSRDSGSANLERLRALRILNEVEIVSLAPADFRSVLQAIRTFQPNEIYYLAGQTSVGLSFEQPFESFESIAIGTLNFLEAIRILELDCRFFNAGSTECFGESTDLVITEESAMKPISPYAVAKATSFWITRNYRKSYGLFACTGLLSNHESPLRPTRFVTSKIVQSIRSIQMGTQAYLELGNLNIARDWGWAADYVDAIYRMTTASQADDYIIATGTTHSLIDLIEKLCRMADLEPTKIIKTDPKLLRPSDLSTATLSADKIKRDLNWTAKTDFSLLVSKLFKGDLF
ncbi:GDP-mannose 4,6-dehydratase [Synechococcus elongatus]|uniref:GDP-mannose 4,6-dehydratase n=1 Tax=Synechococcus elongatus PCC 11802 TaxID=2283154 RepID=A0AAT9JZU6_SYNEL|nr:GDP-mannose 4,6-dehydratase [Synechococcus elongatus]QFZ92885.1 GDP-mannose 4,6-dehydratase [Synechococcus elongatus PCC 11802]